MNEKNYENASKVNDSKETKKMRNCLRGQRVSPVCITLANKSPQFKDEHQKEGDINNNEKEPLH